MTISEAIKLQAKLLEWEAPKGLGANLKGYNTGDYIWITNGIVVARIFRPCYMLSVSWHESIKEFTMLSLGAVKGWLTPTQWRDNEYGVCVKVETYGNIDSCLHCPFPDCIQPFDFKYPSERKRIIYKTRVEAMNTKTGEYIYFKSVKDAARRIGVTYGKIRSRVDKDIDCNGYIVRKVKVNA